MLYLIRFRIDTPVRPNSLYTINAHVDDELIPTLERVEGVVSARAYSTFARELVLVLELKNAAALDSVLASPEVDKVCSPLLEWMERSGPGELMFDRPQARAFGAMTFN